MSYTDIADRTTVDHPSAGSGNPRGWTFAGIAAGIAGITGIAASMSIDAVYDTDLGGDPQRIVDRLSELTANMLVFHVATMVAVVTLVVFAAGLRRRLAAQAPSGSALPDVAAGGLLLTSVAGLMGAGLNWWPRSGRALAATCSKAPPRRRSSGLCARWRTER